MKDWQTVLLTFGAAILPCLAVFIWYLRKQKSALEAANVALREQTRQREALIRELHHRTKNNLQEISSMLYLQMSELEDERLKNVLDDARGRIDALGIIHRLLYQKKQDRFTAIRIADYVRELVQHLERANDLKGKPLEKHFELQDVFIEMDEAVHIGLALNELVQNCFKHAFAHAPAPALHISLRVEDGELQMCVRDNGPGLGQQPGKKESDSFGLKLVRLIVEGREGTFSADTQGGAVFKITVPLHGSGAG